jgi:hypothetical protein
MFLAMGITRKHAWERALKKNRSVPRAVSGKIGELQRHHAISWSTHKTKYGAAVIVEKYENS